MGMLFDKYQYPIEDIQKRGYSESCRAFDGVRYFWVKWILGIEKSDTKAKMLSDKLRHLQKARHIALPNIVDYGFDDEQKAYAIVYEYLEDVETLEDKIQQLKTQSAISNFIELCDCLQELHLKFRINHGDIHPANILIDKNGQFYLVDFGLADITKTFSQEKSIEVFARAFAAPEKFNRLGSGGFPFQSDVFSLGKVLDWMYRERQEELPEEQNLILQRLLAEIPANRPTWALVIEFLKKLAALSSSEAIQISFRRGNSPILLDLLNGTNPIYDISPKPGLNYLVDIIIDDYICEGVIWVKSEDKLLFDGLRPLTQLDQKQIEKKLKDGRKLPFKHTYTTSATYNKADLTPYFQKWYEQKQTQVSLRENRKAVRDELGFYRDLLEKEKEVIGKKSLRLQYSKVEATGDELILLIKENEKYSSIGTIMRHVEEGNDVNSEGFEYILSANSDRKQNKETVEFAGKPYDYDPKSRQLKIKDCERLNKTNVPHSGFLFENTKKKEEEKNRQLDAIRKVEKNEVQNPDLIYYLFKPDQLQANYAEHPEDMEVKQVDDKGKPLVYSYNQQRAIQNALFRTPLSVIQGPPGTGKTTVITEIVFQILTQKPEAKILITSQANDAVDQVLQNLLKNNIPILRLSGITAPKIQSIRKHTIDKKLEGWKQQVVENAEKNFKKQTEAYEEQLRSQNAFLVPVLEIILEQQDWEKAKVRIESVTRRVQTLKELHTLPEDKDMAIERIDALLDIQLGQFLNLFKLHRDWVVTINSLDEKSAINQRLIDSIRVIGATCNHIAAKKYSKYNFEFDYVIMDESGKATTAEALVPLIMGKNLIFVGDHRQLRPMLTKTKEVESWLRDKFKKDAEQLESFEDYFNRPSLFEQVIIHIDQDYKTQLTQCRRSTADQVKLTSMCFYEAVNDEPIEPIKRDVLLEHNLPLAIHSSIIFIDTGSHQKHKTDDKSRSSFNELTAQLIPDILEQIDKYEKVKEYSFGVITGYTAQYRLLKKNIEKKKYQNKINSVSKWLRSEDKLTVSVVDRFQGLERDIVIVDLVKAGSGLDLGFLETPNRINVALSRQKRLLLIVGDYYGIINAKTRRINGSKASLQMYLETLKPEWVVKAEQINELFI